jgi:hypothetical protein
MQQTEIAAVRFLIPVSAYQREDQRRNEDIRQQLNAYDLREEIHKHQQIYYEYTVRMPTDQIPWKLIDYNPEGRGETARSFKR